MRLRAVALVVAVALAVGTLGACGVEVPDDVAARATSTTAPSSSLPATTAPPTSDDELEQALIDNGYSAAEARCGAERLRRDLDDDEIAAVVDAESVDDIPPALADRFAAALRACVDGAGDEDGGGGGGGDDEEGGLPAEPGPDGRRGGPRAPGDHRGRPAGR